MKRTAAALSLTALLAGGVAGCGTSTAGLPAARPTTTSSAMADAATSTVGTARIRHNAAAEGFLRGMPRMPGWSALWDGQGQHMRDWHPRTAVQRQRMVRLCRDELAHGRDPRLRRMASYLMHPGHDTDDMREMHRLMRDLND